jgi:hypothetical protein
MGFNGFLFEAKACVIEISSEWKIAKFAGMEFSIVPAGGYGAKFESGLIWGKTGRAKFGLGFGPEASITLKWRPIGE